MFSNAAFRKRFQRAAAGFVVLSILGLAWPYTQLGWRLEQATLDYRYAHLNRAAKASDQVVVIDIDEQTFKVLGPHYGRWPWPRRIYKELIEFLSLGEPSALLFDFLFTEAQTGSDDDALLAEISAQTGFASHAMKFIPEASIESEIPIAFPPKFAQRFGIPWQAAPTAPLRLTTYQDFLLPNPTLLEKTPHVHAVTVEQDPDGPYRRAPLVFKHGDGWIPSLTLRAILLRLKDPSVRIENNTLIATGSDGQSLRIPMRENGHLPIHYYRDDRRPESIPFAAVLASAAQLQKGEIQDPAQLKVNPLDFKGKTILLGTSATGLEDLKVTPVSPAYPGVLLHATAISNIIQQDFLRTPHAALSYALLLLTLAVVYGFNFLANTPFLRFGIAPLWLAGFAAIGGILFRTQGLGIELARPLGLGALALLDSLAFLILVESRDKKKLKDSLSKYLPPTMAEQIIASGQDPRAEVGAHGELSILFSDVRGFTSLAEKSEPKTLVSILNEYLGRMTDTVFEKSGTLDKFIGDAVMAFWGAPVKDPEHALHAVECALRMREELAKLNADWAKRGIPPFEIGVGVNTGDVIVGNIGSEKRLDYTVIGDHVNLASRLEGLTKQYKATILVGTKTEEYIRDKIICRPIDFVRVKGKLQPVQIHEPLGHVNGPNATQQRALVQRFSTALELYRAGSFQEALTQFTALEREHDAPSKVFVQRCEELFQNPPESWDGVYTAISK